jgi:hypothetical protein
MSLRLYWIFLLCGLIQLMSVAIPATVAAEIPAMAGVAFFAGWLVVLAAATALYRDRIAAWLAIVGAAPALVWAAQALWAREFGYGLLFGTGPAITIGFGWPRALRGRQSPADPLRPGMSSMTRTMLTALPVGLFLMTLGRWILR